MATRKLTHIQVPPCKQSRQMGPKGSEISVSKQNLVSMQSVLPHISIRKQQVNRTSLFSGGNESLNEVLSPSGGY
ncbi:hypothetical protein EMIT048CA2_10473 [Pseudomonas chlororaphis]